MRGRIKESKTRMAVVYVAGTGRSGSTALDMELGRQRGVLGAGELSRFQEWYDNGLPCTCGIPLPDCPQWRRLVNDPEMGVGISQNGSPGALGELLTNARSRGFHTIVDSSKTSRQTRSRIHAWVATGADVVMVHLVRNPFDVAMSVQSGSNQWLEGTSSSNTQFSQPRVYAHWAIWNATAHVQARRLRVPYVLVTNEGLRADPGDVVNRVLRALTIPLGRQQEGHDPGDHAVAGNRMRRASAGGNPAPRRHPRRSNRSRPAVTGLYHMLVRLFRRADVVR